jgi:hypothetical protein
VVSQKKYKGVKEQIKSLPGNKIKQIIPDRKKERKNERKKATFL